MSFPRVSALLALCAALIFPTQSTLAQPPMGWSSWNSLAERVNYKTIKAQADGLAALNAHIQSGSKYEFVNIDEGWWTSGQRDGNGQFVIDKRQWPGGMRAMAQYIHSKNLKAGIYIDAGPKGCGTRPDHSHFVGSDYAHYDSDFLQFAQWGFDFVKVDFCGGTAAGYDPQVAYTAVSQAIHHAYEQTGHRITLSACDWGYIVLQQSFPDFLQGPWDWAPGLATMWRTTGDIYAPDSKGPDAHGPRFSMVIANALGNYHPESQHTGYYNDPDMMVTGMGLPAAQDRSHVSLWAISGAPLILGNDLSKPLAPSMLALLTNEEVLAVDQDPLGVQGILVSAQANGVQIWSKLLAQDGARAVLLFNGSTRARTMSVRWQQIGMNPTSQATVRDLWQHKDLGKYNGSFATIVPAGGAAMLKVSGSDPQDPSYQPDPSLDRSNVTFSKVASATNGGFIRITYTNGTTQPANAVLRVNGGSPSTVLFAPTGTSSATITLYAGLAPGTNQLEFATQNPSMLSPQIQSLETIAGPVEYAPFQAAYEAEDPRNTLTAPAMILPCPKCSSGYGVHGIGHKGSLTFNGISVPKNGVYTVTVGYVTDDHDPQYALASFNHAAPVKMYFPSTGGPTNVLTISVTGRFKAGKHNTLTFSNPLGEGPNIDGISAPVLKSKRS